jgi:hypothetical protein
LWVGTNPVPTQLGSSWYFSPGSSHDSSAGNNIDMTVYGNETAIILAACTIDAMQVKNFLYSNVNAITVQLYKNGVGQAFQCTTAATVGASCAVTGQSIAVAVNDTIALKVTNAVSNGGYIYHALHCK